MACLLQQRKNYTPFLHLPQRPQTAPSICGHMFHFLWVLLWMDNKGCFDELGIDVVPLEREHHHHQMQFETPLL